MFTLTSNLCLRRFFHLYNVQHVRNTMDFITTITCDKRLFLRFGFNGQRYE